MNKKLVSSIFILAVATAVSTAAWSKGGSQGGQGGGMRSDQPRGQMGREQSSDDRYRKETKEKNVSIVTTMMPKSAVKKMKRGASAKKKLIASTGKVVTNLQAWRNSERKKPLRSKRN